jgi:histidinol-phosphate/aromatic aminotransferase/cobyric acid decarboxylase-like protein
VLRVVERARGLVLLDEAYAEYVAADPRRPREVFTPEAPGWGRVLALRTLSKAFGLAGLRVGYGVGHPAVMRRRRAGARAVQGHVSRREGGAGGARRHRGRTPVGARARAARRGAARPPGRRPARARPRPAPAASHFVFVPVPDAAAVAARMRRRGVAARVFTGLPAAVPALAASGGAALRLNAGPEPAQQALLAALGEALGRGAR